MERLIKIESEKFNDGWNEVRSGVYDDSDARAFSSRISVQIERDMYEKWKIAVETSRNAI
jgi:hypothetical protein